MTELLFYMKLKIGHKSLLPGTTKHFALRDCALDALELIISRFRTTRGQGQTNYLPDFALRAEVACGIIFQFRVSPFALPAAARKIL